MARVLRFRDLTAERVMVPRTEVLALPVRTSRAEALQFVAQSHHSRYPVYRDSIDDVVGVLHVRDLVLAEGDAPIEPLLRQPLILPAQASVSDLLTEDARTQDSLCDRGRRVRRHGRHHYARGRARSESSASCTTSSSPDCPSCYGGPAAGSGLGGSMVWRCSSICCTSRLQRGPTRPWQATSSSSSVASPKSATASRLMAIV